VADFIGLAINRNDSRAADIDNAHLAAFKEIRCAVGFAQIRQADNAADRNNAAEDDAIDMAVGHGDFVGYKNAFSQKLATQPFGIECLGISRITSLANINLHGVLHG